MDGALRLNLDAAWILRAGRTRLLFDPWLAGDGITGWPWFNRQTLLGPIVSPEDVGEVDAVILSQGYSDRAHPPTLARLRGITRVLTVPAAAGTARRALPSARVDVLPRWGAAPAVVGPLRLWRLSGPRWWPSRYHAVLVADDAGHAAVHAPHGLSDVEAADALGGLDVRLVATSRRRFDLPLWLGGSPQAGPEAADALVARARCRRRMAIHDGPKDGTGLVALVARVGDVPPEDGWLRAAVGEEVSLA